MLAMFNNQNTVGESPFLTRLYFGTVIQIVSWSGVLQSSVTILNVSDFLAVCQFPLIQSSDSNSLDLREFGFSIEEHLGIEWKLEFLNHVKS